jgi:GDP-4-dehydro-6-deoxy-D-mannose reductase
MRILVTGASGFVGTHMVRHLLERGDEVVAWGRTHPSIDGGVSVDLMDPAQLREQHLVGLDGVIHLAGLAHGRRSFDAPAEFMSTNTIMQINLFEELHRQASFPRVLVISSGAVYKSAPQLITEESATDASSPYAISKLAQELTGQYYARRGFEVIVARPFNHVGPGQREGYLIPDVAGQIAKLERVGGGTVTVGDLSTERDYTDVRDVARAYRELIANGRPSETYNVCSGRSLVAAEIVSRLRALATVPVNIESDASFARTDVTRRILASNAKIRGDVGWEPLISLDVTLGETLDYLRARR